jgi:hypothetical protein
MNDWTISQTPDDPVPAGTVVRFTAVPTRSQKNAASQQNTFSWQVQGPFHTSQQETFSEPSAQFDWDTAGLRAGVYQVTVTVTTNTAAPPAGTAQTPRASQVALTGGSGGTSGTSGAAGGAASSPATPPASTQSTAQTTVQLAAAPTSAGPDGALPVSLQRTAMISTPDQVLWAIIRNRTNAISFQNYRGFIDDIMCGDQLTNQTRHVRAPTTVFRGVDAYELLRVATDAFLMHEVGVVDPTGVVRRGFHGRANLRPDDSTFDSIEQIANDPSLDRSFGPGDDQRLGRQSISLPQLQLMRQQYYQSLDGELKTVLPYLAVIRERLSDIPLKPATETPLNCYGILRSHLLGPLAIELIWSYWLEEGMLIQTLLAILARFENRKIHAGPDPLARFDLDPLRPLSNLLWGWIQDEYRRLTVRRRGLEYDHEYGLKLLGRAAPAEERVDPRSKFLESFHNLLFLAHIFYKEDDDTTVIADGFPVLNALRETHLLLAEGAHNQFGDLPSTARAEMLIMQWLLARPEMRDFLGGRPMVPFEEDWMDRVDSMKLMQSWTDVSITHFRDLAVFGEQILLAVRYGNWGLANDPQEAANWARYWRPEIQRYVHAYRSATGVDLTDRKDATVPAVLLRRRLVVQRRAQ